MFFNSADEYRKICKNTGFAIFVASKLYDLPISQTITIKPDNRDKITVEKVREIIALCGTRQSNDYYIVILSAEKMNEQAQNALLKLLEEPGSNYHFILQTTDASALLPTVLSRGEIFFEKNDYALDAPLSAPPEIISYAKQLIAATDYNLSSIVKKITEDKTFKKKDKSRAFVLEIVASAIEILYKSYFKTSDTKFLKKLPAFLKLYDNLKQNGNIKLHLVADLC
ncbi:hypothetical protein IJG78_03620 [Candidatus Saccharibacteria bacterium]|nr:hypothetical protein [Candidatus Saccharibacteria bacterium]